jgi:hypothetical protein
MRMKLMEAKIVRMKMPQMMMKMLRDFKMDLMLLVIPCNQILMTPWMKSKHLRILSKSRSAP